MRLDFDYVSYVEDVVRAEAGLKSIKQALSIVVKVIRLPPRGVGLYLQPERVGVKKQQFTQQWRNV